LKKALKATNCGARGWDLARDSLPDHSFQSLTIHSWSAALSGVFQSHLGVKTEDDNHELKFELEGGGKTDVVTGDRPVLGSETSFVWKQDDIFEA
jgi:hypothetical protein